MKRGQERFDANAAAIAAVDTAAASAEAAAMPLTWPACAGPGAPPGVGIDRSVLIRPLGRVGVARAILLAVWPVVEGWIKHPSLSLLTKGSIELIPIYGDTLAFGYPLVFSFLIIIIFTVKSNEKSIQLMHVNKLLYFFIVVNNIFECL